MKKIFKSYHFKWVIATLIMFFSIVQVAGSTIPAYHFLIIWAGLFFVLDMAINLIK